MTNPDRPRGYERARSSARTAPALLLLMLLLAAAGLCAQAARAQSGRRAPKASTPPPAAEATPQGESESVPRKGAPKKEELLGLVVMWYDDAVSFNIDSITRNGVIEAFARRLGQSASVSVTSAGKGRRQEARERAKTESTAYVVLFELEDEQASRGAGGLGRSNPSSLIIKTYVYTPKTADLKYVDTVFQRPYRQMGRIGGVPIPVPTRGVERYPSQYELEQAARDAADRVLARFQISAPRDN